MLDSVTNFTVNENKKIDVCEKQALKLRSKGNNGDDIERVVTGWSASPLIPKYNRPTA